MNFLNSLYMFGLQGFFEPRCFIFNFIFSKLLEILSYKHRQEKTSLSILSINRVLLRAGEKRAKFFIFISFILSLSGSGGKVGQPNRCLKFGRSLLEEL